MWSEIANHSILLPARGSRRRERGVTAFLFKGWSQKLHVSLPLKYHWSEPGHRTTCNYKVGEEMQSLFWASVYPAEKTFHCCSRRASGCRRTGSRLPATHSDYRKHDWRDQLSNCQDFGFSVKSSAWCRCEMG